MSSFSASTCLQLKSVSRLVFESVPTLFAEKSRNKESRSRVAIVIAISDRVKRQDL